MVREAVAAAQVANPDIGIEVAGYTDSTGRKSTTLRLSRGRAAAVRFYLARKGVPPLRMVVKGYGASGYIAPNNTAAGAAGRPCAGAGEHTAELPAPRQLVCRLLLEKKKNQLTTSTPTLTNFSSM